MSKSRLLGFVNDVDAYNAEAFSLGQQMTEVKATREALLTTGMKVLGLKKAEVNDMLATVTDKFVVAGQEEVTLSGPPLDGLTASEINALNADTLPQGDLQLAETVTNGGNPAPGGEAVAIGNVSNFSSNDPGQTGQLGVASGGAVELNSENSGVPAEEAPYPNQRSLEPEFPTAA